MNRKKITELVSAFCGFFLILSFSSCKEKLPLPDEFGFYNDMDAAVSAAKKSSKNILLYITMGGFDAESEDFVNNVLHSAEYKSVFDENFISVHFDFGSEAYSKSEASHLLTKEEKLAQEKFNLQITKNISLARVLDLQYTPSVFLMNRDGYAFSDEGYSEDFLSVQSLYSLICEYYSDFEYFQTLVDATKKGKPSEKVEKINEIYQTLDDKYIPTLTGLLKNVPDIDKKDESGLVSYLYFVYVMEESKKFSMGGDFASAIAIFREAAQGNVLEGKEKQQAFYMAGQMMIMAGSSDYTSVLNFLNAAVLASPDTELAEKIREIISQVTAMLSQKAESSSEEN